MNLVETPRILMLSDSPGAKVSTEYVGAKPSRRISHNTPCSYFDPFQNPNFVILAFFPKHNFCSFGLFENLILSPISQNASLLCLQLRLSRKMRGTNFSEFRPLRSIIGPGRLGYCPRCLELGGHPRNVQVRDETNRWNASQ